MNPKATTAFINDVTNLKEIKVIEQVKSRMRNNEDPLQILEDCEKGMVEVGKLYEKGKYFISSLIVAGEIFRQVAELIQPEMKNRTKGKKTGSILLGTVQGDIHDLGKNLFGLLMKCHGFTVYDLGVDVPAEKFCAKAAELKPDIIGLSGLLTIAYESMQDTVEIIKNNTDIEIAQLPIIIRASLPEIADFNKLIGADYWSASAMSGVNVCKQIISERQKQKVG